MIVDEGSIAVSAALKQLNVCLGAKVSKHDRVRLLAMEAMRLGINRGPDIVAALVGLGYNAKHVGKLLSELAGKDPTRHDWHRDDGGTYRPLESRLPNMLD